MIFIDSWVWIEYFAEDERWKKAEDVLKELKAGRGSIPGNNSFKPRFLIADREGLDILTIP